MEIIQTQVALFFRSQFEAGFEELAPKFRSKIPDIQSQFFPVPPVAPPEIPRLLLSCARMKININISKNRADIFFNDSAMVINVVKDVVAILTQYKITIDRIGFVQKVFIETGADALLKLISEDKRPSVAKELVIRINLSKNIGEYECNNIETLTYATATKQEAAGTISKQGVMIERDVNTLIEKRLDYDFTAENISQFIEQLKVEADNRILLKENGN